MKNSTDIYAETDDTSAAGDVSPRFWPAPAVTQPTSYQAVRPGFLIKASGWAGASPIHKWNVFITVAGESDRKRRYEPPFKSFYIGGVAYSEMQLYVPVNHIPPTNDFYIEIEFQATVYSNSAWVWFLKMQNLPAPVITHPGVVHIPQPEIQGTGDVGATIKLYQAGAGTILFGTAAVLEGGSWKTTLAYPLWMADPFNLTASQTLNGIESGYSTPVSFAVLFRPVIADVTVSADGKPTVRGSGGLKGATLEIWNEGGGGGVLLETSVQDNGSWSVTAPAAWPAGRYRITAIQVGKVTGKLSDWAVSYEFVVNLPVPMIISPAQGSSHPAGSLVVTGSCLAGARVEILNYDNSHLDDAIVIGTAWSYTRNWDAGRKVVKARQTVSGATSGPSGELEFFIRPSIPMVSLPERGSSHPAGSLEVKGSCLADATVEILNYDNSHLADACVTGTAWTYTRNWDAGRKVVKARQTINGATSEPSGEREFFITATIPVISLPAQGSSHPAGSLTVTGSCLARATVEILNDDNSHLADALVSGTAWSYTRSWDVGRKVVKARQTVSGATSEPSDAREFFITATIPGITLPTQGSSHSAGSLTVTGSCLAGATVEILNWDNSHLADANVTGTAWSYTRVWDAGRKVVKARQTVNGMTSDPSGEREFFITVAIPEISLPERGSFHPAGSLTVTGSCLAGAGVQIQYDINSYLANATVNGTYWTYTRAWDAGRKVVKARQTVNGATSQLSDEREFFIRPSVPVISLPSQGGVHPIGSLTMTGSCHAGATVEILNSDNSHLADATVSDTRWSYIRDWDEGRHVIKARQTVNGMTSEPSGEREFFIKTGIPLIVLPEQGSSHVWGPGLRVSGSCLEGAKVEVLNYDDSHLANAVVRGTDWDYLRVWGIGRKVVKARQTVNGVISEPGGEREFFITPRAPTVSLPERGSSHPAGSLTVTGRCSTEGTVEILNFDNSHLDDATVSGSYWSCTRVWDSGRKIVKARETYNGVSSEPSDEREFFIVPDIPVITSPTPGSYHSGGVMWLQGSCLAGAKVYILNEDNSFLLEARVVGTNWSDTRSWTSGSKVIKARQTVNGVDSEPSGACEFFMRPAQPRITQPSEPVALKQVLEITRIHDTDLTLVMFNHVDGTVINGTFSTSGTTRSFTPAQDWALGANTVTVVQTVEGAASAPSNPCTFIVEVVKPKPPIITFPQPHQIIDLNSSFTGTDGYPAPDSVVSIQEPDTGHEWARALPRIDGTWTTSALPQGPGSHEIHGFVLSGEIYSEPVHLAFKIRPPKPAITPLFTPVELYQPLTITGVYSASATLVLIDGTGNPVSGVFDGSGAEQVFTPDQAWRVGENRVTVTQTEEGVASVPSDECIFTVVEQEKPEAPQFERPLEGTSTPTRPVIEVHGIPDALITVRLKDDEVLNTALADGDGVLVFSTEKRLRPGTIALEAKQLGSGPESEWSAPHPFIVKPAPNKPEIKAPIKNSRTARTFTIWGNGETGGEIQIFHADDLDQPFATTQGRNYWHSPITTPWELGNYRIQVRQVDGSDSSDWTDPRPFEVVDTRFLIGATGSVVAQPVVSNHESVLLRVQVVDSQSWEGVEGLNVVWSVLEDMGVRATTLTDRGGWAHYRLTPQVAGDYRVQADVTSENEGVDLTQVFDVTALADNPWSNAAELYLDGEKVDFALGELQLLRGRSYELELRVKSSTPSIVSDVTLEDLADAASSGLESVLPLGTSQEVKAGAVRWTITSAFGQNSYFGLKLTNPMLPDWWLPGRLLSNDLADDVRVLFDGKYKTPFGEAAFLCHGTRHTLTIRPTPENYLIGKQVTLHWLGDTAADLGVVVEPDPATPQIMDEVDGVSWTLDTLTSLKDGFFAVQLNLEEINFQSMPLAMGLAHNRITPMEVDGPHEYEGGYRQGIRAGSYYTSQPVEGGRVLVEITGREPRIGTTDPNGWLYVQYSKDESAVLTLISPYNDMDEDQEPST